MMLRAPTRTAALTLTWIHHSAPRTHGAPSPGGGGVPPWTWKRRTASASCSSEQRGVSSGSIQNVSPAAFSLSVRASASRAARASAVATTPCHARTAAQPREAQRRKWP
eukprot:815252-Prymnesium_polylepis.2